MKRLPREVARAAANQLEAQELGMLTNDAITCKNQDTPVSDRLKRFAHGLMPETGLKEFLAVEAAKAAIIYEAALRFAALTTGDRADAGGQVLREPDPRQLTINMYEGPKVQ